MLVEHSLGEDFEFVGVVVLHRFLPLPKSLSQGARDFRSLSFYFRSPAPLPLGGVGGGSGAVGELAFPLGKSTVISR